MIKSVKDFFAKFIGKDHDISLALGEIEDEGIHSPFYGYFVLSWLVVNWDFLYAALFVSGESLYESKQLLRNEYLLQEVLPRLFSLEWWSNLFIIPLFFTVLTFWVLPFLTREFYRKHIRNKKSLEVIRLSVMKEKVEAQIDDLRKAEMDQVVLKRRVEKENPEVLWKQDYAIFKEGPLFSKFKQLVDAHYKRDGALRLPNSSMLVETEMLLFAETKGLINVTLNGRFTLTDKGRFFFGKYSEDTIGF